MQSTIFMFQKLCKQYDAVENLKTVSEQKFLDQLNFNDQSHN